MTRRQADNNANNHTGKDGDDGLMDGADTLDLEVVRDTEGHDKEHTEDAQPPSVRQLAVRRRNPRCVKLLVGRVDGVRRWRVGNGRSHGERSYARGRRVRCGRSCC